MKKLTKKSVKKIVSQHNRQVSRTNKAFQALSPAEKRVYIARDVLAQIAMKKLVPTSGVWLTSDTELFTKNDVAKDPELQDLLKKTKQCEGCAIGGMFMCAVQVADQLKISNLEGVKEFKDDVKFEDADPRFAFLDSDIQQEDAFKYLRRFFSSNQLAMIETAFEKDGDACHTGDASANFVKQINDPSERMQLIMQNIIVNKGTFRPEKKPVQMWVTPGFIG
jgi:hypothetical protein